MTEIAAQVEGLDADLFSLVEAQLTTWDRRALLALHAAVAGVHGSFRYLEIGSYRGGFVAGVSSGSAM
jgi:hypothetical protein